KLYFNDNDSKGWRIYATDVSSWALAGSRVFYLKKSGDLFASDGSAALAQQQQLAGNVKSFALEGSRVWALDTSGELRYTHTPDNDGMGIGTSTWIHAGANVDSFALAGNAIFVLWKDGNLTWAPRDVITPGPTEVGSGSLPLAVSVRQFVLGPGGYTLNVL